MCPGPDFLLVTSLSIRNRRWIAGAAILAAALIGGRSDAEEPATTPPDAVAVEATPIQGAPPRRIEEALEMADGWIARGASEKALALLRELLPVAQAHGADTTRVRFLTAQALMRLRRFEEAAIILAELVTEQPAVDRFVLDYAATLFALERDDDARAVFRNMRSARDLPPRVRRNVERFLEQIRARQTLRIDFDLGFWNDANVNSAPERETVEVPVFGRIRTFTLNEQPVSAWVARTGVTTRWRKPIDENRRFSVVALGSVARNTAIGASEHNRTWARASFGPRLRYSTEIVGRRDSGWSTPTLAPNGAGAAARVTHRACGPASARARRLPTTGAPRCTTGSGRQTTTYRTRTPSDAPLPRG